MEIKLNDYKNVRLKEIGDFKTSSIDKKNISNQKKVFMINYMDVYKNKIINKNNINELMLTTAKDSDILNNNLLKKDILFIPSSEVPHDIGNTMSIIENLNNVVFSYHLIRFRINNSKLFDEKYLNYCFKAPYFKKQLTKLATGSTRYTISIKDFGNVKFKYLIDINKQKMIGNFLSNIDKKIEKIKDGIKIIEEYKKIFLNNIFSNNNHNKEKLFDVSKKIKSGGTPLSSNKSYYGNGYKFAKINDLTSQGKYVNDTEISITEEGFNNSSSWLIPKNNLLYSMYASIGFPAINKIDIVTNQAIAGIILDKDKVDLNFIYYFLLWNRDRVLRMVDLGVQGNLNIETIKNIKIPLIDLMKQELISEFLSNIDKKVDIFNLKLKHLIKNKFVILDKIFN